MHYFGGKFKIIKDLANVLNPITKGKPFVDLFCGACNVVEKITTASSRTANDNNPYLIALLKAIQDGYEPPTCVTREQYNYTMSHLDENPALSGFVGIGCSFSGGWHSGYARPINKDHNYPKEAHNSLLRQKPKLGGVTFTSCSYDKAHIPVGAVVYCDPPYKGVGNKYYARKFDYDAFVKWVEANKDKYDIYISEYKENFAQWPSNYEIVWEKESCQEMSKRKKTTEVLIHAR